MQCIQSIGEFQLGQDPEVSGLHATFQWNLIKDCLQIRDEKSFNGTALNLVVLEPGKDYTVHNGSTLHVGRSKFIIYIKNETEMKEDETSNSQPEKAEKEETTPDLYCPICFHSLKEMSIVGRTQHVNNCLSRGNQQPVCLNYEETIVDEF